MIVLDVICVAFGAITGASAQRNCLCGFVNNVFQLSVIFVMAKEKKVGKALVNVLTLNKCLHLKCNSGNDCN